MRVTKGAVVGVFALLVMTLGAQGETEVLEGLAITTLGPDDPLLPLVASEGLTTATLLPEDGKPIMGGNPVDGVPEYVWWYGCSPTAGGMMIGYWDAQPGRENLYKKGDSQVWWGDGTTGTRRIVASEAHITAGLENGYTYGDWHNSASYPNHETNPDCLADYMHTVDCGSYASDITVGLEAYAEWDDTSAYDIKDGYEATATLQDGPYYGGTYGYNDFKEEIEAGQPVMLSMVTALDAGYWVGHSVVGYGYQDDMFQVKVPTAGGGTVDLTVGGFAVLDTWSNGSAQSEWVNWGMGLVLPSFDAQGVEWWPFIDFQGSSWIGLNPGPFDWMVIDAIELYVVPEPVTLSVLAMGGLALLRRRK